MSSTLHCMPLEDRKIVESLEGNSKCIDCGSSNTDWASVSLGTLFCLECSGKHRGLGTHISFVRSVRMDSWTRNQLQLMKAGGNQQCKDFLVKHGIEFGSLPIKERYDCPAAELYRQVLKARLEGRPEPTDLPKPAKLSAEEERERVNRHMQGFGSGPHPREERRKQRRKMIVSGAAAAVAIAAGILLKKK